MKPRLLAIASHPIQYFVPIYRELAQNERVEFRVLYCREYAIRPTYDKQFGQQIQWDMNLLDGYEHLFIRSISPIKDTFNPLHAINPGIIGQVLKWADAIWINGVVYPSNWIAIATAKAKRIPILMRSEMNLGTIAGHGLKARIKRSYYRNAFKLIDRAMVIGTQNRQAYSALGLNEDRFSRVPYVVDMRRFQVPESERLRRRQEQRLAWGLKDEDIAVLFLGKLTDVKNPEALLALDRSQMAKRLALVWVGAGEKEKELKIKASQLTQTKSVFGGLVNQSQIPDVLWAGDIFIFPSKREQWGLVLNEAMAAGLPAVVSDRVGAACDLCFEGETGYVVPAVDDGALIEAVDRLAADAELRRRMGRAAVKHIAAWTPQAAARGVEEAVFTALARFSSQFCHT